MPRPTIADLAERAGVSKSTVSRVFDPRVLDKRVSPATQERIRRLAEELGWRPDGRKRAAARHRTWRIAFLYSANCTLFWLSFRGAVERLLDRLATDGFSCLLMPIGQDDGWRTDLPAMAPDCLVVLEPLIHPMPRGLTGLGIPVFAFNRAFTDANLCLIVDDLAGAHLLVDHLAAQGRRRLAYVAAKHYGHASEHQRQEGFRARCTTLGLAHEVVLLGADGAAAHLVAELAAPSPIDGLVFYNYSDLLSAAQACPDLLTAARTNRWSLACCDDIDIFHLLPCPVIAARIPAEPMAERLAWAIHAYLEDGMLTDHEVAVFAPMVHWYGGGHPAPDPSPG